VALSPAIQPVLKARSMLERAVAWNIPSPFMPPALSPVA
jgi:hypothetical protein